RRPRSPRAGSGPDGPHAGVRCPVPAGRAVWPELRVRLSLVTSPGIAEIGSRAPGRAHALAPVLSVQLDRAAPGGGSHSWWKVCDQASVTVVDTRISTVAPSGPASRPRASVR